MTDLSHLARPGAEIVTTEMVLFEWLAHCRHPQFKPVLQLVKDMPLHPPPV